MNKPDLKKHGVCGLDATLVNQADIDKIMLQLQGWTLFETDGAMHLKKSFTFDNFENALSFTHKVYVLSEQENHHPAILMEWDKVTVSWWSHMTKGLHVKDFIMAAKTDALR
jgi:4a-hydroxytetrahydrobiopterin dehydratase